MRSLLPLLIVSTVARAAGPSPTLPAFDPAAPETWRLAHRLAAGSELRQALSAELSAPTTEPGQVALTQKEIDAILDDPRAQATYGARTRAILAPSMLAKQTQAHENLLQALLAPRFLDLGTAFAQRQAKSLARAEKRHNVPREVIVSILMWETRLGAMTGNYNTFNVFTTQAYFIDEANALVLAKEGQAPGFDSAQQAARVEKIRARAKRNLLALLRAAKADGLDPLALRGSWAGAIGFPQFMPASLRFAEDGDGDGKIDLFDPDDAIASVGSYLAHAGYAESPQKAVWDYNHEDAYVTGVLQWADALKKRMAAPSKSKAKAKPRQKPTLKGAKAQPKNAPPARPAAKP